MDFDPSSKVDDEFELAVCSQLEDIILDRSISLKPGHKIMVSFSGGPDSTALLRAMQSFCKKTHTELHACHINHGIRGEESDADEQFCKAFCDEHKIIIHSEKLEGCGRAEAELRATRYTHIQAIAEHQKCGIVLTGHTLDDQVETMLFRLFRGTGPSGLLGIPIFRALSERVVVLRPLLNLSRVDCEAYLKRVSIIARKDSSNADESYSRNYIRHRIIPLIDNKFPGFRQHANQLRKVIEADEALLAGLSQDAGFELIENGNPDSWTIDKFNELPLSLRRRVMRDALRARKIECDFATIESALDMIDLDGSGAISLNENWELRIANGEIEWQDRLDKPVDQVLFGELSVDVKNEGLTFLHSLGLAFKMEKLELPASKINFPGSQEHEAIVNLSNVGQLKIRLREAGDQIHPLGMNCMVRLKKFLHTHKSTKTLSFGGRVLVLANNDEVIWVPGCGISQRVAISDRATHRISLMRISPDEGSIC